MAITLTRVHNPMNPQPMGQMNVTPFIDVLLVLLIMLIMTIPIATHTTDVDLPASCSGCTSNADRNTVTIDEADRLFWNGAPVTREALKAQVGNAARLPEEPLLEFKPAALASYDASAKTIALIKDAGATRFAFIGDAEHRSFGQEE
ncbi:outer membrane transport energization protein ExbD [Altererythrobacter xiamenensis]|uniref:Outer membrane transport energization protein ExbD n=1 Tax=Altererythrobacter xiamenensis TaxID=1316679 RepID=A0A1Y6F781_9SPHN|nr:biopolymer transporter ExbD [Altererythrobacter xiamenensis]SMQ69210.1 outer membrane transport energization protein ExbD [Altererythrobacter xiamenensis]